LPKIKGGYYIKARCIQESEIRHAPPHFREIWDWLLKEANHSDVKYGKFTVKRGQCFRTYQDIRDGLSWNVGYRKERYSENQTKKAMKYLRDTLMIDTTKELGGVLITICNYEHYQNPKNYERTKESTNERTNGEPMGNQGGTDNNKNEENEENEYIPNFESIWKRYPNKDGKKESERHFNATVKTEEDFSSINKALDNYLVNLSIETWKKPKSGSTWFNNWQDWTEWEETGDQAKDYEVIIDGESQFLNESEFKQWKAENGR
jgi:hypothetical protein